MCNYICLYLLAANALCSYHMAHTAFSFVAMLAFVPYALVVVTCVFLRATQQRETSLLQVALGLECEANTATAVALENTKVTTRSACHTHRIPLHPPLPRSFLFFPGVFGGDGFFLRLFEKSPIFHPPTSSLLSCAGNIGQCRKKTSRCTTPCE